MTHGPEGFFLQQLFVRLNASRIRYAVMRNHHSLPYSSGGSDLDILVTRQDGERTKALLYDAIHQAGGVALGISETLGFFKIFAFGQNSDAGGSWWGQRIDVNVGLFFKGQSQLADDEPWPVSSYRGITVLADGFAGVLGVLKEVLNSSTYPARYAAAAREGIVQDWPRIKKLLFPMGDAALEQLKILVSSEAPPEGRGAEFRKLRNAFLRHVMFPNPREYLIGRLSYEWSKVRRYFKPSGKFIAVLGVDGAGKSTIINSIRPALDDATHNATVVHHLRPTWLPPLARMKGKKSRPTGPVLQPHDSKPSGPLGSLFRLIYLSLDYVLGYWFVTRLQIAKQPTVVIFDRYAYDMVIDPRRFRIALPAKVIRWFTRLAPRPDLIFCLYGTPGVLAARKQELPLVEVARQVDALKAFAANEPHALLVSTDGSVQRSRDEVLSELKNRVSSRIK
jgi:thymidylate kinase